MLTAARLCIVLFTAGMSLVGCSRKTAEQSTDGTSHMLELGVAVPNLSGIDQNGNQQHLAQGSGRPLLVYFYPKDGTPGCTKEACAFRDVWNRFEQQRVRIVGVSSDDRASHEKFASTHRIPFALIADSDAKWATAFGVPKNDGKFARVSFLFDKTGHLYRIYPKVDPGVHADEVLRDIAAMP